MDHVAIMKKSLGFLEKVANRKKKIESRWYKTKHCPWDSIKIGEKVYFKNSGGAITFLAKVKKVIQFSNLSSKKVKEIINLYWKDLGIDKSEIFKFYELFKDKKYCILIFIENPIKIKPFEINKQGFGNMSAWITVDNIKKIIKKN